MELRYLQRKDAPLMLEWMHDGKVTHHLHTDFAAKTLADCQSFIESSRTDAKNLHMAVVDDTDTYMGTVSLKHIDRASGTAEFAITMRTCAMGRGFAAYAMAQILRIGHEMLHLPDIYWCVSEKNLQANRFYEKNGYRETEDVPRTMRDRYGDVCGLRWFCHKAREEK